MSGTSELHGDPSNGPEWSRPLDQRFEKYINLVVSYLFIFHFTVAIYFSQVTLFVPSLSLHQFRMQLSNIMFGLSMLAISHASPLASRSTDFIGSGQLILEHNTDTTVMGCLTVDGLLTVDTTLCGIFKGTQGTSGLSISSSAGDCGVYNNYVDSTVDFTCGDNAPSGGSLFDVSSSFLHVMSLINGFEQSIALDSKTVIFTGDLEFSYAPYNDVYPTGNETTTIHLWGDEDSGEFSAITWSAI